MFSSSMLVKVAIASFVILLNLIWGDDSLPFLVPWVFAHCDTLDGPVIRDARKALEAHEVSPVLKWVANKDEGIIKSAFEKTLAVRQLNPRAKDLADTYFFETLVRIHRAGEGEPYSGLKPATSEPEPGVEAADQAVASGRLDKVLATVTEQTERSLQVKFDELMAKKKQINENVDAGREYVAAYGSFVHFVHRLYQLLSGREERQPERTSKGTHHHHPY